MDLSALVDLKLPVAMTKTLFETASRGPVVAPLVEGTCHDAQGPKFESRVPNCWGKAL